MNIAFNEATLLGIEFDADHHLIGLTISGVCMNLDGSIPDDRRVVVILEPVGKFYASLRNGLWDDDTAEVIPFSYEKLLETVQSFRGLPVYGWKFFDCGEEGFNRWKDRLSLKHESGNEGISHTLDLFQDDRNRILDIRIWFDNIHFLTPDYTEIPMEEFIAAGKRAWDAIMLQNDKKTQDTFAIYPGVPPESLLRELTSDMNSFGGGHFLS